MKFRLRLENFDGSRPVYTMCSNEQMVQWSTPHFDQHGIDKIEKKFLHSQNSNVWRTQKPVFNCVCPSAKARQVALPLSLIKKKETPVSTLKKFFIDWLTFPKHNSDDILCSIRWYRSFVVRQVNKTWKQVSNFAVSSALSVGWWSHDEEEKLNFFFFIYLFVFPHVNSLARPFSCYSFEPSRTRLDFEPKKKPENLTTDVNDCKIQEISLMI